MGILGYFYPSRRINFGFLVQVRPTQDLARKRRRSRESLDNDHESPPTMRSVGQAFSRLARGSDTAPSSPSLHSSPYTDCLSSRRDPDSFNIDSRSPSHFRSWQHRRCVIFQRCPSGLSRNRHASMEDLFVPINPHKLKTHIHIPLAPPGRRRA